MPAQALPGQTPAEVAAWIQGHPTLRPESGEKLMVRKSDSIARRFTFQASLLQVGKASSSANGGVIRTERFTLFDMTNGVTRERLAESLRNLYGLDIYQDYAQAKSVYQYPVKQLNRAPTPLANAIQGQIRQGDRFAYWVEIAQTRQGYAYSGEITVFLKDDLPKLETELRERWEQ
ncbi:MAG: hypothetical protein KME16_15710 [Scytolyngbya sp. HA4215-MV1]|nr:hypothetical protein [Scytolyngbya sp. HA4215-MV1]